MVSFWPDSIWTPEFTDLATVSPSPHRHLDAMAVAAAAAVLTENVPLVTSVVDTVRRHPALLAQTALTIDHLAKGRFILGLGSGETENTVPYGFDFTKPVSRFEEALEVIRLLWDSDGPVDFDGQFYQLHHARLDTEPYEGTTPRDLDRRERAADAGDRRTIRRRVVARRRVDSRRLCRKARRRTGFGGAGRPRSDGHHAVLHPGVPDRPGRSRARGDSGRAAGQGVPAAGVGGGACQLRLSSIRWGENWRGLPGHRPGDVDPGAHRRVPRPRRARIDPGGRARTARRSRSPRTSRTTWTRVCGCRRSWIMAVWLDSRTAAASADNVREAEDELMRLCGDMSMSSTLDAADMLRRAQAETGLTTTAIRRCRSVSRWPSTISTASEWTPTGARQAADVCHWLLTTRLGVLRGPQAISDRRRGDRAADVRHG